VRGAAGQFLSAKDPLVLSAAVPTAAAPAAPLVANGSRSRVAIVLASGAFVGIGTLLQLPRQSGVQMWRTVWAEDGTRFYTDALARPWRHNVLESYAGYAHVVPRSLASIGVHLPPPWYSAFVTLSAALAASLLSLFVYFASAPLLRSRVRQAILAAALLFWPVLPFEITGSITNIQWMMPVACLLAVLLPVERPWAVVVRLPIVVLAPLSSPICVLFVPIALFHVLRVLTRRASPARSVVPIVCTVAAMVQLVVFATAPQATASRSALGDFAPDVVRLYGTKVVTELLYGVRVTDDLWSALGYGLAVLSALALGAALVWRVRRAGWTSRWLIASCVVGGAVVYAASVWQRSSTIGDMLSVGGVPYNFAAMRYQLFPAALLLFALLVPLDLERGAIVDPRVPSRRSWSHELRAERLVLVLAAVWAVVAFVPSYRLDTARSGGPDWVAQVDAAEVTCARDPASGAVVIAVSPVPDWSVALPCWELAGAG
jgi:hypothetical protein